jgi:DNA-binding GntR family transcriptional regulator
MNESPPSADDPHRQRVRSASIGGRCRVRRGLAASDVEHRAILAAIERGNCDAASNIIETHIQNARDRIIRAMTATGQLILKDDMTGKTSRRRA